MDLGGVWRAVAADETLRRAFADPEFDDIGWGEIPVPHHWRSQPDFSAADGPLLYRRPFDTATNAATDVRTWLQLDGMFYQGDVWFDGSYLGDTEGYFFPHSFEVTEAVAQRDEHLLAIELACDRPTGKTAKRNLTGVFQHWDCIEEDWNPGGIWRPVRLLETGPVRLARLRVLCSEATEERAAIELRATLDAHAATVVTLTTVVTLATAITEPSTANPAAATSDPAAASNTAAAATSDPAAASNTAAAATGNPAAATSGPAATTGNLPAANTPAGVATVVERAAEHFLAAGANEVRWRVTVEHPALWWPHALGDQPLYDITVTVAAKGARSDHRTVRTGLRQVRMRNFVATVNGERLFLKGTNMGPTNRALGEVAAEHLERDVLLARSAGLDLLRVHGHISRPELYDAADRLGMLLWQDLPLQWGYARVRQQAIRQAGEAVDQLGHHPSVAVWCGHNEPLAIDHPAPPTQFLARQLLPTWNKSVLDRSIHRALEKADGSRPVVAHSGVLPHPAWGTDSHLYFGWYLGEERELNAVLARLPVLARFVSEFGAQAVPDDAPWARPEQWPDLDWDRLARAHCLQKDRFDRYVPPASFATFDAWQAATQAYQAQLVGFHVETLRRLKYRPTGGFCQFLFGDSQPAVTWSVMDDQRRPKRGWHALSAACAPVIVVAERPADTYRPGDKIQLEVHVVSDLRVAVTDARCRAVLSWTGETEGSHTWEFAGDVDADSCVRVGVIHTTAPASEGPLYLDLDLTWPGGKAHNRYVSRIAAAGSR